MRRPTPCLRPAALILLCSLAALATGVDPLSAQTGEDLTLADALSQAFASHPSLRAAEARQTSAYERVTQAGSARWPTLALQYGITRFEEPMVTEPIHAFDPNRFPDFDETLVQGRLGLNYTLLDWGTRSSGIAGSTAMAGAAEASTRLTRMRLIESVTGAYLRLAVARAVDTAAGARVEALQAEVARARNGVDAGTAAAVEVLRATTALQDALATRTTTVAAVARSTRDLARLTGIDAEHVGQARLDEPSELRLGAADADESPAEIIQHPMLAQAARRAEAARAEVGAERSGRLPRLDLTGAMLDYGTLDNTHSLEWQVGAQLSWTVFSGGRRGSSIRRAEADLSAAHADLDALALDVAAAEDAARTDLESAAARVEALDLAVEQWEELVRIETLALAAGAGTQRDLLDAQAGLFNARAGRVQAYADAALARVRLASAQGMLTVEWLVSLIRRTE